MLEEKRPLALLRLSGEIGIKGRATRFQFRNRLLGNLRDALDSEGLDARVQASHDRLYIELPEHVRLEDHALARVFGISSLARVERHPVTTLDEIVAIGDALFRDAVRGKRFAVRARRVGAPRTPTARGGEVERALGERLLGVSAGVDLRNPEVTARVEITASDTSFVLDSCPGPGGLPLGCEGRAVSLLSGGFDSAVATWQVSRRGVACDYVFCNLGGEAHLHEVLAVARHLADRWSYGTRPRLHAIDFEGVADALRAHTMKRFWQVLLKRQMLRAATAVAEILDASAIVTGDAVGQVSSQTLQNLDVVSRATDLTVLRPLIAYDKQEIVARAREIGTYELSKSVGEYCALVTNNPATRARLDAILAEEARLPEDVLAPAVAARTVFDLRSLDASALADTDLAVERLPEDCVLIDLRPLAKYRSSHHPDALHLDFARTLATLDQLDKSRRYVLCCEYGLLSAQLASLMHREGFRAQHFRGGQRALMKQAASAPTKPARGARAGDRASS